MRCVEACGNLVRQLLLDFPLSFLKTFGGLIRSLLQFPFHLFWHVLFFDLLGCFLETLFDFLADLLGRFTHLLRE